MVDANSVVEIQDLTVRFGKAEPVLNRLSLRVARGERVAVVGPSGAGKTTLFRSINGFARAESGRILVQRSLAAPPEDVTELRGAALRRLRSRIGVISQRHDLVEALAVYQNVMAGALGRWSALRALRFLFLPSAGELDEAAAALREVGLEHKLRVRTESLSGGEHQRVAIARALVQRPVLLIADEPVASLDPDRAEQVLALLSGLAEKRQVTLLCSLHQPALAEQFFDRVVEIRHGEVVDDRAPRRDSYPLNRLSHDPVPFAARFSA